jgi:hypothetical protein
MRFSGDIRSTITFEFHAMCFILYLEEIMRHAVCAVPRDRATEGEHHGVTRGRNEGPKDRIEPAIRDRESEA